MCKLIAQVNRRTKKEGHLIEAFQSPSQVSKDGFQCKSTSNTWTISNRNATFNCGENLNPTSSGHLPGIISPYGVMICHCSVQVTVLILD